MAKILVVEDEPNNLELALRIVRHAGHEATVGNPSGVGCHPKGEEGKSMRIVHVAGWRDTQVVERLQGPGLQDGVPEVCQQCGTHWVRDIIRCAVGYLHVDMLPRGPHTKTHTARLFGEHGPGLFHVIVANGGYE